MLLETYINYINSERNAIRFNYDNKEVSWNDIPLSIRKDSFPHYFLGEIDCFPFMIGYDPLTGEPRISNSIEIKNRIKKIIL